MPFGFLLTQYTITGFDACAHLSEETASASKAAAKGIWRSILYSVLGGYILLLCVVFAIPNDADGNPDNALAGGGVAGIFVESLGTNWATLVLFISASAQFFCATSCMTSASRMTFAFSRDGAIPGSKTFAEADRQAGAGQRGDVRRRLRAIVTLPALIEVDVNGVPGARSRSTRSPRSRSSGSTWRSRSRSTCAGGTATSSRSARGTTARSTSG